MCTKFRQLKQPRRYQTDTLTQVVKAVSILIGFMLGLFLTVLAVVVADFYAHIFTFSF